MKITTTRKHAMMLQTPDPGRYEAKITKIEEKPNKAGDGTNLVTEFTITEGDYEGRAFLEYNPISKDMGRAKIRAQYISACCANMDNIPDDLEIDTDDMLNKPVVIELAHELYQGNPQARISMVLPVGTALETPFD